MNIQEKTLIGIKEYTERNELNNDEMNKSYGLEKLIKDGYMPKFYYTILKLLDTKNELKKLVTALENNIEMGKVDFGGDIIPYQVIRIDQTMDKLIQEAKQALK